MEEAAYEALAQAEGEGWYYRARLQAVDKLLRCFAPLKSRPLKILDIGSGTGGSTIAWAKYGKVLGIEPSALARRLAQERFPELDIRPWDIESLAAMTTEKFDIALILCVLYHQNIKQPSQALQQLAKVQEPGSILIWNEPAYAFLWRQHDRQTAAGRRFHPRDMHRFLAENGYDLIFQSHLLAWAFPIACLLALKDRWVWGRDRGTTSKAAGADHRALPWPIERLLKAITLLEWNLNFCGLGLGFGVSHLLVARRRSEK